MSVVEEQKKMKKAAGDQSAAAAAASSEAAAAATAAAAAAATPVTIDGVDRAAAAAKLPQMLIDHECVTRHKFSRNPKQFQNPGCAQNSNPPPPPRSLSGTCSG